MRSTQATERNAIYKQDIKQYGAIVTDPPCFDGR
jgi:hypothetical protein